MDRQIQVDETRRAFYHEKNQRTAEALEERIKRNLAITDVCLEEDVEEEAAEDELPEMTDAMAAVVEDAWSAPQSRVLIDKFNIEIRRKDVETLRGLNWLNDEVINFYMQLIVERGRATDNWPSVYAFTTFFYPKLMSHGHAGVRRWTKKVDVFSHDLLLVPVHLGMHWCLATVDLRARPKPAVRYYDSMGGDNHNCLTGLLDYLEKEHQDKKKTPFDTSG